MREYLDVKQVNSDFAKSRSQIKKGKVLLYLKKQDEAVSDVEIAIVLKLPVSLVRNELNRLVDKGAIAVKNSPAQDRLNSGGLVYVTRNV